MPHSGDEGPAYNDLTIMQKMELVRTSRNSLKTSLTNKGKTPTTNIRTYSALVDTLTNTSDANAIAENIDSGKTAYVNGVKLTGTSTKVDTTDATAVANEIESGKTAYVNGSKVTGTLASNNVSSTLSDVEIDDLSLIHPEIRFKGNVTTKQIIPSNGAIELSTNASDFYSENNINAANIKVGETILGVTGTFTSDADATAVNIDNGKTAYVNGVKVTGTSTKVDTSDANAVASNIDSGKTAYVNGTKITGTSTKVDTSDADATANDITVRHYHYGPGEFADIPKTAYVNGVKIEGEILDARVDEDDDDYSPPTPTFTNITTASGVDATGTNIKLTSILSDDCSYAIDSTTNITLSVTPAILAQAIGLTADKIKAGTTILGITGTYETDLSELEAIADDILGETTQQGGSHSG